MLTNRITRTQSSFEALNDWQMKNSVSVQDQTYRGNAAQVALFEGAQEIMGFLITTDANINAQGGLHGIAFEAAAAATYIKETPE